MARNTQPKPEQNEAPEATIPTVAPATEPVDTVAASVDALNADVEAERARRMAELDAEMAALREERIMAIANEQADAIEDDDDEDAPASMPATTMDTTIPGGAFLVGGTYVDANGKPLPESLGSAAARMHEAAFVSAQRAIDARLEKTVERRTSLLQRALSGV